MPKPEPADVPSPIDLRRMSDAREWERNAMVVRPWREEFFACFLDQIQHSPVAAQRILELGSGPGFLADHLIASLSECNYVMLDFSPAMHELARIRLGERASQVEFVERSFKDPDWTAGLGSFGCIVTNQAVHELRHKRYAGDLHRQARSVLAEGGLYLVCDHFSGEGGMANDQLYMTVDEQRDALLDAGFARVEQVMIRGGMVLHRAL